MGMIDASRESLDHCLQNGISVAVVVGGAAEALDARPGTYDLTLSHRFGFIRLAMENGASLIPVFTFGENDVYKQLVPNPPNSLIRRVQDRLLDWLGFSMPLVHGVGFLPLRRPIVTVVGRPIPVPHLPNPTLQQILEVLDRYTEELRSIYSHYQPHVAAMNARYNKRRGSGESVDAAEEERAELKIVDSITPRDVARYNKLVAAANAKQQKQEQQQTTSATAGPKRMRRRKRPAPVNPTSYSLPTDADDDSDADGDSEGGDETAEDKPTATPTTATATTPDPHLSSKL